MFFDFLTLLKKLSRLERYFAAGAGIIFITAATLFFASVIDQKTAAVADYGGTYREGMVGQPIYINPVIAGANDVDKDIAALVYNTLTDLTSKITRSENGLVWTIRLKEELFWHNGQRITADDVVFTIEKIQDPEARSPLFVTWQGVVADRISELELTLTTGAPYAFFEDNLKSLYIIPKHLFADAPTANWRLSSYNLEPIGSGPYKFLSYKKEKNGFISEYRLVRNENYFKGRPFIEKITFSFFTNEVDAVQAFNVARIDAISGIDAKLIGKIKRPHQLLNMHLPRYYAVFFNQSANDMLKDKNVRIALNYAVDKKKIVDDIFNGYAAAANGPVPFSQIQTSDLETIGAFNPEQANKILDEAGMKRKEDGFRGEIKLVVPQLKFLTDTADLVKSAWEAIGIKTTLVILDPVTVNNEVIKTRNYEALIFGNIFTKNPDLFSFWHSSERFYPGLNLSLYNNKIADKFMETVRKSFDEKSRERGLTSLQSLIIQDAPALFLYSPNYIFIADNRVGGADNLLISAPSERFASIEKWFVKTKRVWR